jgi:hypothetical protein
VTDRFDVTCRRCRADVTVVLPAERTLKPFSCPGCGAILVVDAQMPGSPDPGADPRHTPVTGAKVTHLFGHPPQESVLEYFGTCPVCGIDERLYDHSGCEDAQQVELYSPEGN